MFHENLKTLRRQKGFSQEQLAVRLNVTRQTISKWEKGLSVPDAELLIKLGEVLETSVNDLLGKKVEISQDEDKLEVLSRELSKLNELLVAYGEKANAIKKKAGIVAGILLLVLVFCAIYEPWTNMWHEFGEALYYILNGK